MNTVNRLTHQNRPPWWARFFMLYRLDDLTSRERLDAGQEKPARLAVIGHPVAHSLSPRMHQPALDEAGIAARYIKVEIDRYTKLIRQVGLPQQ